MLLSHKSAKCTILLWLCLILVTGCVSYKLENKKIKLNEVKDLAYFEPLSYVNLIHDDNTVSANDSLSLIAKLMLDTVITQYQNFEVSHKIEVLDLNIQKKITKELNYLVEKIMHYQQISNIKLTPTIDSVLKNRKQRFALATVVTGMGIEEKNRKQPAKRIDDAKLTLDNYAPIAQKPLSTLFAIIIDAERSEVIFYDHTTPVQKSPTEKSVLKNQYRKLFKGYYHK